MLMQQVDDLLEFSLLGQRKRCITVLCLGLYIRPMREYQLYYQVSTCCARHVQGRPPFVSLSFNKYSATPGINVGSFGNQRLDNILPAS